ncbi:MAG TPA: sulfatase [Tepidisphaeraceae bacterium]|nr:sulfatase [Tepidisphaeraceae bacterium]
MTHRAFFTLTLLIVTSTCAFAADRQARKRNVLFVTADDYNVAMGAYGNPLVHTPNLDRLAARGVRFERAYCQHPLCNPSRASFMSGLRPNTTGVLTNGPRLRNRLPEVVTLPQLFRQNGYIAARVGKIYHQGIPGGVGKPQTHDDAQSWDLTVDPPGAEFSTPGAETNPTPERNQGFRYVIGQTDGQEQHDHQAATEAIRILGEHKDKPIFLAVGFIRPHVPPIAPRKHFQLHPLERIKLPQVPADDRDDIPIAAFHDPKPYWNMTEQQSRESIRAYYASISLIDEQVGRLVEALERLKLSDDTLIVFLSDHGYLLGEHQTWQKMMLFEEASRVPMIISGAGVRRQGAAPRGLVELIDVYPTVAELCGLKAPQAVEGLSLKPMLDDAGATGKPAAFTQLQRKGVEGRAVRTDRWRYTEWNGGAAGVELYDHEADPREHTNLARNPKHADTVAELKRLLATTLPAAHPAAQQ